MPHTRTYRLCLVVLTAALLLAVGRPPTAWADAAPPARPPGSSLGPGETVTQVQMVSEEVLLEVVGQDVPPDGWGGLAADHMMGRVAATFLMRNQGQVEEAFDVWFPLGAPDGYSDVTSVSNFQAWVDGQPAALSEEKRPGQWESTVPWATWPVTFPPGQDVVLRVSYDVLPDGYYPFGTFPYVLETGAGWWGPIGAGTITLRLPYQVNEDNAVLGAAGYDWLGPNPAGYTVSGTDVVWRFTDLEPTDQDNVMLTALAPRVWEGIVAARQAAAQEPASLEAQLGLARALNGALYVRHGLEPVGNSPALAEEARAAYRQALELAPQDVELHVEYLDWQQGLMLPGAPELPEDWMDTLQHALELDPENERLLALQEWVDQMAPYLATATPAVPSPTPAVPTVTASARATPAPAPTASPTATARATPPPAPTVTASATATATPAATRTAAPSPTSPPTTTAVPSATPQPQSSGGGICPGTLALGLVPLGALVWRRRRGWA